MNAILNGVNLTRDLVSEPGNILHPDEYAKRVSKLKNTGLKITIYDEKQLKKWAVMHCWVLDKEV